MFGQLNAAQACALLSCFVCDEKSSEAPKLSEELSGPLRQMQVSSIILFSVHETLLRKIYLYLIYFLTKRIGLNGQN